MERVAQAGVGESGVESHFVLFGFVSLRGGFVLFFDFRVRGAALLEFLNCLGISAFGGAGLAVEFVEDAVRFAELTDQMAVGCGGVEVALTKRSQDTRGTFEYLIDRFGFRALKAGSFQRAEII